MKNLAKIIVLQVFWYIAVYFGQQYQTVIFSTSLILATLNYFIYKPNLKIKHYFSLLTGFIVFGLLQEWLLERLGLVNYNQESFPLWLTSLWVVFVCYYGDIFDYMYKIKPYFLILMGGVGGVAAFYGGAKISPLEPLSNQYFIAIFISWAIFFPGSILISKKLSNRQYE